jgi:hypothetical protein
MRDPLPVGAGPQRYDGKVDLSQRERFTPVPSPDPELILETAVVYAPRLRRRLRIVVVTHRHHRGLAVLFSTDLDLDPITLYRYYVARFHIEFLFRDSKQFAGLTHGQARDSAALTFHANASLTAISLSKLQAVQTLGHLPVPFSMASVVRRCFNEYFIKKICSCKFSSDKTQINPLGLRQDEGYLYLDHWRPR